MPKAFMSIGLLTIVVLVSAYSLGLSQPPSTSGGEFKSNGEKVICEEN